MEVMNLVQGTDAWHQFRFEHDGASEAAAMLGLSRTVKRNDLLRMKKTGIAKTFSDWVQENVLDYGHEVEALARPIIAEILGVELYPVTCSNGQLSASCDGLDMADEVAMEHKQWNEALAARVGAGSVPLEHLPQCQQVLMVTGAERMVFVVSDGTREKMVWCFVEPDPEWFERIRAGWAQFHHDLAVYVPTEPAIELVGRAPETLPALHIVLKGEVSASNLAEFKEVALTAIRSVNRDLKTDQDFADSAKARKWCEDIESRVAAAKEHALSQTATIDMLFRTMDEVSAEARDVRLALEKLEKARKESRKGEIVAGGIAALRKHIDALNARLGKPYMPAAAVDFGAATRNLRTFDSMQNAVDTALANAKIAASATADRIDENMTHLNVEAAEYGALFPDLAAIVTKQPDDFRALVQFRVADHKAKEQKRADALAEQARERIRAEEAVRIQREQEAERRRQAEQARADAAAATPAPPLPVYVVDALPEPVRTAMRPVAVPTQTAKTVDTPPTLTLGQIGTRLGFNLTAEFVRSLGFEPTKVKASLMFHESEFDALCTALIEHVESVRETQTA